MDYFEEIVKPPLTPYHDAPEPGRLKPYQLEWLGDGMPPAATKVEWPEVGLDGEGQWAQLSALDWLAAYPNDPYWREAGILGLIKLAHTIAICRNRQQARECRGDAGGADLFSDGLLAVAENIDKDLPTKVWGLRIARGMDEGRRRRRKRNPDIFSVDWRAIERLGDTESGQDLHAASVRDIADYREPWHGLAAKEASEILESCLADPRTRHVIARKVDGWTEREIAAELGVEVGVVKRIVEKTYLEACAQLGLMPRPRKTRAPGRDKPELKPKKHWFDWDTLARLVEHNAKTASDFVRRVRCASVADGCRGGRKGVVDCNERGSWSECVSAVMSRIDDPLTQQVMERVLARRWTADQIAAQIGIDGGTVKRLERTLRYELCIRLGLDPMKCRVWELGDVADETDADKRTDAA